MGDILGIGTTHYPPGLVPDELKPWPLARMLHPDPRIPEHLRNPASWPEPMRAEWGNDEGIASFKAHRARVFSSFRTLRDEIAAFRPDFILIWGDDQYENFREDVIPPFCVYAFDEVDCAPFKASDGLGADSNVWNEPRDTVVKIKGHREAANLLTQKLLESGFDVTWSYRLHHAQVLSHAFARTILYLDYDRKGFPYPIIPFHVNCYGSNLRIK